MREPASQNGVRTTGRGTDRVNGELRQVQQIHNWDTVHRAKCGVRQQAPTCRWYVCALEFTQPRDTRRAAEPTADLRTRSEARADGPAVWPAPTHAATTAERRGSRPLRRD